MLPYYIYKRAIKDILDILHMILLYYCLLREDDAMLKESYDMPYYIIYYITYIHMSCHMLLLLFVVYMPYMPCCYIHAILLLLEGHFCHTPLPCFFAAIATYIYYAMKSYYYITYYIFHCSALYAAITCHIATYAIAAIYIRLFTIVYKNVRQKAGRPRCKGSNVE